MLLQRAFARELGAQRRGKAQALGPVLVAGTEIVLARRPCLSALRAERARPSGVPGPDARRGEPDGVVARDGRAAILNLD
jgi:hypothetical protein